MLILPPYSVLREHFPAIALDELKELIGLDKTSSVLCFSTEGDTDPDQYRRIVWEGEYPTC